MAPHIGVLGCGMMSPVGLSAPASCAAIRAGVSNFQETRFVGPGGDRIVGAEVPLDGAWRGVSRLARLLAGPLRECLELIPDASPESMPVLMCVAEEDRPGRLEGLGTPLFLEACALAGVRFHPESRVFSDGRVAAAVALHNASRLIHEGRFRHVIVAGVDSYLIGETVDAYAEADRLLSPDNSDGFVPGETGAALLLGTAGAGLQLLGQGFAKEPATRDSDEPLRADGMTEALRTALASAGTTMARIGYRIADLSGEQYGFKEADLAVARLLRQRHDFQDVWHPAECIGEVGAAIVPVMVSVALVAARKAYAAGDPVLIHTSNDDIKRAALVLSTPRAA